MKSPFSPNDAKASFSSKKNPAVRERNAQEVTMLFADIAHALQTPLSCLIGELELLEREHPGQKTLGHVERCEHIIQNMSALIHNALYISRLEHSQFEAFMKEISLSDILTDVIEYISVLTNQRRIELSADIQSEVSVFGISEKIEELVIAVLSNSVKYAKPRGVRRLSVTLHTSTKHAVIHVQDNGIGIAKEDLPHIFNRFYRTPHASKQSDRGTGLGLAIAQKIAEKHHARITVESTLGKGTHVQILFPLNFRPTRDAA
jgi:signal transduction histidine kinase